VLTVRLIEEFQRWLDGLADRRAQVRIVARLCMAEAGNLGDWVSVEARSQRCVFTSGLVTASTSRAAVAS